jgi:hypothetical protein
MTFGYHADGRGAYFPALQVLKSNSQDRIPTGETIKKNLLCDKVNTSETTCQLKEL